VILEKVFLQVGCGHR